LAYLEGNQMACLPQEQFAATPDFPMSAAFGVALFMECGDVTPLLFFMECGDVTPLLFFMECGDVTPLLFFMECGDVTPLLSLSVAWQRAQKKNSKKQERQRNKSGVTSPHSINSATPKGAPCGLSIPGR
jgi:hypothetical protein